jgi:hypothetical protein
MLINVGREKMRIRRLFLQKKGTHNTWGDHTLIMSRFILSPFILQPSAEFVLIQGLTPRVISDSLQSFTVRFSGYE